jgi:hypothetical protein
MAAQTILRKELEELVGHARYFTAMAVVVVAASCISVPVHWPSLLGGMLLGLVGFVCAVVSWRLYHPWLSWLIWVVPLSVGFGSLIGRYGVSGQASTGNLLGQALWGGIVVFFGLLWLLRRRVLRWTV